MTKTSLLGRIPHELKYFLTNIARNMSIIVNFATIMDIFIITV